MDKLRRSIGQKALIGGLLGGLGLLGGRSALSQRVDKAGGGGGGGISGITVKDGSTTVNTVTTVNFSSGATVTAGAVGTANVAVSGGNPGLVLISSGAPVGALEELLITIPASSRPGRRFFLNLNGLVCTDVPYAAISYDGVNFLNDPVNSDTYYGYSIGDAGSIGTNLDGLLRIGTYTNPALFQDISLWFRQGNNSISFGCWAEAAGATADNTEGQRLVVQDGWLNPLATVPPTFGETSVIAILPYGNGAYPPTSGHTFTLLSWTLSAEPE